jgi:hypothetical protein
MLEMLKARDWPALFGFFLFIGMMAAGYTYNLTFVQLGLEDFGSRILGLSQEALAADMSMLALLTCFIAIGFGLWMQKHGWGRRFTLKLRMSFLVVFTQTLLTLAIPWVANETGFLVWLVAVSLALGIGIPVMFSMTIDLVPVRLRGSAAALVTATAYFAAETFSSEWSFEFFRTQSLGILVLGTIGVGLFSFVPHPWLDRLARQHTHSQYRQGRFVQGQRMERRLLALVFVMFAIYFVDSLGFMRLLKTPLYMSSAWQSPELDVRLFISGTHVIGALVAGILYSNLRERPLFLWVFGIFALTHLQYSFQIRIEAASPTLSMPMLYALAVSLYTVISFAVWADVSTPDTICLNSALGVALSGWTATFISTGLALDWSRNLSLERHIQIVDSLAVVFFIVMGLVLYFQPVFKRTKAVG